jgi:hypothetical protein
MPDFWAYYNLGAPEFSFSTFGLVVLPEPATQHAASNDPSTLSASMRAHGCDVCAVIIIKMLGVGGIGPLGSENNLGGLENPNFVVRCPIETN